MWEIFQSTGHIGAYLAYRSCIDGNTGECDDELDKNMECN